MTVDMADVEGAALATWLSRRANQYDPDPQFGVYEAFEARCADALYELASQALAGDRDHDRATLLVHADLTTLLHGIGTASIDDGPALSQDTLRRLACDARLQLALTDPEHTTIGVGRTTRTIPPWLARLVRARDRGCRFPLCRRTRWTQVHHIIHWADGGATDLDNLITLCGRLSFLRPWLPIGIDGGKANELPPPAHPRTRMDHHRPSRRRDRLAPARRLRFHPGAAGAPAGGVEEGVEPDAARSGARTAEPATRPAAELRIVWTEGITRTLPPWISTT